MKLWLRPQRRSSEKQNRQQTNFSTPRSKPPSPDITSVRLLKQGESCLMVSEEPWKGSAVTDQMSMSCRRPLLVPLSGPVPSSRGQLQVLHTEEVPLKKSKRCRQTRLGWEEVFASTWSRIQMKQAEPPLVPTGSSGPRRLMEPLWWMRLKLFRRHGFWHSSHGNPEGREASPWRFWRCQSSYSFLEIFVLHHSDRTCLCEPLLFPLFLESHISILWEPHWETNVSIKC